MSRKPLSTDKIITMLAVGPSTLAPLTKTFTAQQLQTGPKLGDWSLVDILAHLRACSDVWGNCISVILTENSPSIRAINPGNWIKSTNYAELGFQTSLNAYTKQRKQLLELLKSLKPKQWQRTATVIGAGATLQRSVHAYAEWIAVHERSHFTLIKRFLKTIQS